MVVFVIVQRILRDSCWGGGAGLVRQRRAALLRAEIEVCAPQEGGANPSGMRRGCLKRHEALLSPSQRRVCAYATGTGIGGWRGGERQRLLDGPLGASERFKAGSLLAASSSRHSRMLKLKAIFLGFGVACRPRPHL